MKLLPGFSRRFRRAFLVFSLLLWSLTAYIVFGPEAKRNVMPGPLSDPHAFLAQDCAHCHVDGTGLVKGLATGLEHSEISLLEGHRCLDCHERGTFAFQAHSADPARLAQITADRTGGQVDARGFMSGMQAALGMPSSARGELACAVCHREHRGQHHDLRKISDAVCQVCHVDGNDHFPDHHPAFDAWPYQARNQIIFDHAAHEQRHFPQEAASFACASCHDTETNGGFMQTKSFRAACASCHHHRDQIAGQGKSQPGIALLTAFGLDLETLAEGADDLGHWPADGMDFEGRPTAFSLMLMAADPDYPEAASDLKILSGVDLADLMDAEAEEVAAAKRLALAFQRLLTALAERPTEVLSQRLGQIARDLPLASHRDFVAAWSGVALQRLHHRWRQADVEPDAFADGQGRWYLDEAEPALRYVPVGHADPVLTYLHDLAYRSAHEGLIAELEADGRCTKCHSVSQDATGLQIHFEASRSTPRDDLTHFDHRPHLRAVEALAPAPGDATCGHCHQIEASDDYLSAFSSRDPKVYRAGFAPVNQATCASCHGDEKTGSSCVDCHNYHLR